MSGLTVKSMLPFLSFFSATLILLHIFQVVFSVFKTQTRRSSG